jgi:hypothetical protein
MNDTQKPKIVKWIEETEKIEVPTKALPRRTYDERLVAFIDILGMTALVRDSDAEEILTIMGKIQKCVEVECEPLIASDQLNFLQLGDGFIFVAELDCINEVCKILSTVQWQVLVYSQMLLRGALTAGKVIMSDDSKIIIGPAFIDAFSLENENAIFPRIIYANEIENYILKKSIDFKYIVEDNDKLKYLDFISYICDSEKLAKKTLDHLLTTQGIKDWLSKEYSKLIIENRVVAQKYGWLISEFVHHGITII